MALKGFVDEARKTNQLMERMKLQQPASEKGIIDVSQGQAVPQEKLAELRNGFENKASFNGNRTIPSVKPKTDFEKQYFANKRESEIRIPSGNNRQKIDERHGNIIANVIRNSGTDSRGNVSWEQCKFKKESDGNVYCKEFHSLCGKDRCKRATR